MIQVAIHPSQFPALVRRDLIEGLRQRRVKHKFHYESYKQARQWLALHEAHSPARNDPACLAVHDEAFAAIAQGLRDSTLDVIGLGCGGGQKDAALIGQLKSAGNSVIYTAIDVSLPLVITARQRVSDLVADSHGIVCDLEAADDLNICLPQNAASKRIITFFGMLPNSEPEAILPRLRKLADPGDLLLMSANLAPGRDYAAAVQRVLPQYDNRHTADWLMTLLYDLGVERSDGQLAFSIEECQGLRRIRADFRFSQACSIGLEDETVEFKSGDAVRLFFSYRYTPGLLATQLSKYSFAIEQSWIAPSGEEGVFIVRGA